MPKIARAKLRALTAEGVQLQKTTWLIRWFVKYETGRFGEPTMQHDEDAMVANVILICNEIDRRIPPEAGR